jgi:hypothetical protein
MGHYHDLLNDIGKEAVIADIVNWLEARPVTAWQKEGEASAS